MNLPVTTPCAHNFCKVCLEGAFAGKTLVRERTRGGRTLRSQKNVMQCPSCPTDISEFLQNPQVNTELMDVIESLKRKTEESADPVEDLSDEETNESGEGTSEKAGVEDDLSNPPVEDESERACKRKKVDGGEIKVSKKPGGSDADSEARGVQSGNLEGRKAALQVPAEKQVVGAQTINKKDQVAVEEGDSPSSTLQLQSSDEDFE